MTANKHLINEANIDLISEAVTVNIYHISEALTANIQLIDEAVTVKIHPINEALTAENILINEAVAASSSLIMLLQNQDTLTGLKIKVIGVLGIGKKAGLFYFLFQYYYNYFTMYLLFIFTIYRSVFYRSFFLEIQGHNLRQKRSNDHQTLAICPLFNL